MLPDFSIYEAIRLPVFVLAEDASGDLVFVFVNAVGCEVLACEPRDVVGQTAKVLFQGRAADVAYAQHRAAWQAGVEAEFEFPNIVDGETQWFLIRLTPQRRGNGTLSHMVGVAEDITVAKSLEQAQAMTDAVAAEMEDFVSFAAHDLRSPIANVKMITDMLRDGFVDMGDGKFELITMIEKIAEGALDLVTDVLTQASATRTQAEPTEFVFRNMCDNILATLDPAQQHQVSVSDVIVEADVTAVQIIVRNLVDNAFKHAGLNEIDMRIEVQARAAGRFEISVTDNGKGFSPDGLATLQDEAASAKGGFGLIGVRRLVRARGGQITVGQDPHGTGAQVRVDLPGYVNSAAAGGAVAQQRAS